MNSWHLITGLFSVDVFFFFQMHCAYLCRTPPRGRLFCACGAEPSERKGRATTFARDPYVVIQHPFIETNKTSRVYTRDRLPSFIRRGLLVSK